MNTLVSANIPSYPLSAPLPPVGRLLPNRAAEAIAAIRTSIDETTQGRMLGNLNDGTLLAQINSDMCPLPAPGDRELYYRDNHIWYWASGFADAIFINHLILEYLDKTERDELSVFDFGCASGRVLRQVSLTRRGLAVGCDINPNHVEFIRAYLPVNVFAFHSMVYPPLPLRERSIDFFFALSVFTHIADFEEAWLLEIARILKPGGVAFITVHTERTFQEIVPGHWLYDFLLKRHSVSGPGFHQPLVDDDFLCRKAFKDRLVFTNLDNPVNTTHVFHQLEYIRKRWGLLFNIEAVIQHAHGRHQDGVVLRVRS